MRTPFQSSAWLLAVLGALALTGCGDQSFFEPEASDDPPVVEKPEEPAGDEGSESDEPSEAETAAQTYPTTELPSRTTSSVEDIPEMQFHPIRSWVDDKDEVAVENLLDRPVPFVAHVYVHSGGVLLGRVSGGGRLGGLDANARARFMPAPKESPELVKDKIEQELVDRGYDRSEAKRLLEKQGEALFEQHGARAVYIAPDRWVNARDDRVALGAASAPPPTWRR